MGKLCDSLLDRGYIEIFAGRLFAQEVKTHTPSQFESSQAFAARRKLALKESLLRTFMQADAGYISLLEKLDEPERMRFEIALKPFNANDAIQLYEHLGWDKDMLRTLYKLASNSFEQKCYQNAINELSFLSAISPLMGEFWLALGKAYQADNKPHEAQNAYQIVQYLEAQSGT